MSMKGSSQFTSLLVQVSKINKLLLLVQGWCSGESTSLPPMWARFDSHTLCHMWVEFVGSTLCNERFFPVGTLVFPSPKKKPT